MRGVLVDAGFLIALLDRDQQHHVLAAGALEPLREPLYTVWPAVTEAMHFLGHTSGGTETLCDLLEDGAVELLTLARDDVSRMKTLMRQYADLPMDFADAALVCVAERDGLNRILSFDKDFRVYRLPRRGRFEVLPSQHGSGRRGPARGD